METYKTEFVVKKWKASNAEGVSLHEGNKNCTSCVKSEKKKTGDRREMRISSIGPRDNDEQSCYFS